MSTLKLRSRIHEFKLLLNGAHLSYEQKKHFQYCLDKIDRTCEAFIFRGDKKDRLAKFKQDH
jgi:hypothetical protein